MKLRAEEPEDYDGYIIHSPNGDTIGNRAFAKRFDNLKRLAGLNGKGIGLHSLRHTFATEFYDQTGDVKALSKILGHSSVSFTLETYVHMRLSTSRTLMQNLSIGK